MRVLEYTELDTSRVARTYAKVCAAIEADDFRAAQVRKLAGADHGKFYRARLDDSNRLLFTLLRHGGETCALMLEVIAQHDYAGSRFLRGAVVDEAKIAEATLSEMQADAQPVRYLHPQRRGSTFARRCCFPSTKPRGWSTTTSCCTASCRTTARSSARS